MANINGSGGSFDIITVTNDSGTLNSAPQGSPIENINANASSTQITLANSDIQDVTQGFGFLNLDSTESTIDDINLSNSDSSLNFTDTNVTGNLTAGSADVTVVWNGGTFSGSFSAGDGSVNAGFTNVSFTSGAFTLGNGDNSLTFASSTFPDNTSISLGNGDNNIEISGTTSFGNNSTIQASFGTDLLQLPDGSTISYNGTDYVVGTDTLPSGFGLNGTVTLPNGSSFSFANFEGFASSGPVCFTTGTELLTPRGFRRVEELTTGDQLIDMTGQPLSILWIGKDDLVFCDGNERHKPIEFKPGTLGPGVPQKTLVLSPFHRLLMNCTAEPEKSILCHAKGLTRKPGIRIKKGARAVTYYAVLLERHAVINANGTPCESFFPGSWAMTCLGKQSQDALVRILETQSTFYEPAPFQFQTVRETRQTSDHLRAPQIIWQSPSTTSKMTIPNQMVKSPKHEHRERSAIL